MSNVRASRTSQRQFVARWWLSPSGYRVINGSPEIVDERLVTTHLPNGLLALVAEPSDERTHPYSVAECLDWIVADDPNTESEALGGDQASPGLVAIDPLKSKGLHREFSELRSPGDILEFAAVNGFLGRAVWRLRFGDWFTWGEPIDEWIRESNLVRVLLRLWQVYTEEGSDEEFLQFLVLDDEYNFVSLKAPPEYLPLPRLSEWPQQFPFPVLPEPLRSEQLARSAARTVLVEVTRWKLHMNTLPWFDLRPGGIVSLAPTNLLGAVYVQFLQEFLGRSDPMFRCACCGKWFLQPHAGRIYCSNACKQKAYRRGKTKVKESNGQ